MGGDGLRCAGGQPRLVGGAAPCPALRLGFPGGYIAGRSNRGRGVCLMVCGLHGSLYMCGVLSILTPSIRAGGWPAGGINVRYPPMRILS